nr:methyltransferase-like 26 [Leptinotarsa decemlineata]
MSRKIYYPATDRNKTPILQSLLKYFDRLKRGSVLEISSGTGQHVVHFANSFPMLTFQPSENEPYLLDSIREYVSDTSATNIKQPLLIDVRDNWTKWNVPRGFDYAININMMHVAPFECSVGLFKNVSEVLKPGGLLVTYGPYANGGVLEPKSNRDFDRSIRQQNPEYGVRDICDLVKVAEQYRIKLSDIDEMPANNKLLVWQKLGQDE